MCNCCSSKGLELVLGAIDGNETSLACFEELHICNYFYSQCSLPEGFPTVPVDALISFESMQFVGAGFEYLTGSRLTDSFHAASPGPEARFSFMYNSDGVTKPYLWLHMKRSGNRYKYFALNGGSSCVIDAYHATYFMWCRCDVAYSLPKGVLRLEFTFTKSDSVYIRGVALSAWKQGIC
jgi:hypothetical protein